MMKSGVGAYAVAVGDLVVGAVVVVNAVGDVLSESGDIISGMRSVMARALPIRVGSCWKKQADADPVLSASRRNDDQYDHRRIVTNGRFDKAQLKK